MKALAAAISRPILFIYNKMHWFTDKEAWAVFRFFAIFEAIGWTLLISAIIWRNLGLPEGPSVVWFAGNTHGIIMGVYYIIVLVVARSMEWGAWRVLGGLAAGVPPYGSVVFERLMNWHRQKYPREVAPPENLDD